MSDDIQFHLDRIDVWLKELWGVKSIDLHMSDPAAPINKERSDLVRDIRDDVSALRRAYRVAIRSSST
jgi:hypothetical protein